MNLLCWNGQWLPEDTPLFSAQNRGFRYGDGLFETIKVYRGSVLLFAFHYERLQQGLQLLGIQAGQELEAGNINRLILELCWKNNCAHAARVRWAVYRTATNQAEFVLEAQPLPETYFQINEEGWVLTVYPFARKSCDALANLKTANYLPYVLAGQYAQEKGADECLLLNTSSQFCEASKANLFLIVKGTLLTPALNQGCVSGVLRRFIIEKAKALGWVIKQGEVSEDHLLQADEVFLTNAIQGMRWVKKYRDKTYHNHTTKILYQQLLTTLYNSLG